MYVRNDQGEPQAWVGRNVRYEQEHEKWIAGGRQGREPQKYRFPNQALFRRGLEWYGQGYLQDERFAESLRRYGIIIVEGFTDRLRLHELGVMSLAMMSNRITDEQCEGLVQYSDQYSQDRIGIMHDADIPGDEGAKEALWRLHEAGVDAYLVWSRKMFAGQNADRQPESLCDDEWRTISAKIQRTY